MGKQDEPGPPAPRRYPSATGVRGRQRGRASWSGNTAAANATSYRSRTGNRRSARRCGSSAVPDPRWASAVPTPGLDSRAGGCTKTIQRLWREKGLRVPIKLRNASGWATSTCPADRLAAEHPTMWGTGLPVRPDSRRQDPEAA
jgi:hypothetical protein